MTKLFLFVATVFLLSCKSQKVITEPLEITPTESSLELKALESISLQLVSITVGDHVYNSEDVLITLQLDFEENSYSGKSGCNSFFGSIDLPEENSVYLNVGGMTEMMCSQSIMEWESRFLNNLIETEHTISEINDTFVFSNANSSKVLVFKKVQN